MHALNISLEKLSFCSVALILIIISIWNHIDENNEILAYFMRISVHRMMSTCKPRIRNLQWSKSETFGALSCECWIKVQTGSLYKYPWVMEAPAMNVLCPGISGQWQPGAGEGCVLQLDELMTASVWGNIREGTVVLQSKVYFARVLKKVLFFFFF